MTDPREESLEALSMYAEASKKKSEQVQEQTYETPVKAEEDLSDSDDEDTKTADDYNRRRRDNAEIVRIELKNKRREQEIELRREIAKKIVRFVAGQLILTNMLIWIYFLVMLARDEPIPSTVIASWLGSALVEILGLLWVIARSLFPFKDRFRNSAAENRRGSR